MAGLEPAIFAPAVQRRSCPEADALSCKLL
jgi:hypothetical protein